MTRVFEKHELEVAAEKASAAAREDVLKRFYVPIVGTLCCNRRDHGTCGDAQSHTKPMSNVSHQCGYIIDRPMLMLMPCTLGQRLN